MEGPPKEVMFLQSHEPGHMAFSDFTKLKGIKITIKGAELKQLLYHLRLPFSKYSHMEVVIGGESFQALSSGMQNAFWSLGRYTKEHRTDSLSAAYKNRHKGDADDLTQRYHALCKDYNMKPSRNNKGEAHENGAIESPYGHIKRKICQALLLRGSNDFDSIDDYKFFIRQVVEKHNRRNKTRIDIEKLALQKLPC